MPGQVVIKHRISFYKDSVAQSADSTCSIDVTRGLISNHIEPGHAVHYSDEQYNNALYGKSSGLSWQFCFEPTSTGHACMLLLYQVNHCNSNVIGRARESCTAHRSLHAPGNDYTS